MGTMPHRVLSETIQDLMEGRTLRTGLFFTFEFDPAFFEQEILPVFFDVPLEPRAGRAARAARGRDPRRRSIDLAVYYDPRGLCTERR